MKTDILILGGGAAGFFAGINLAENDDSLHITILERGSEFLTKVRVSGGGRCNVTHACFLPNELSANYPRGERELLGPFHTFMTGDTIAWFEDRGVELHIEDDGRMFPVTNSSATIIDCFLQQAKEKNIELLRNQPVTKIAPKDSSWKVQTKSDTFYAERVIVATGSNPKIWKILERLGHTVVPGVPSLFTFNIKDKRIEGLAGVATPATVEAILPEAIGISKGQNSFTGPLLITHWGISGPAVLKLSAWEARAFAKCNYKFLVSVNWLPNYDYQTCSEKINAFKFSLAKQSVGKSNPFGLPKRLWRRLVNASKIGDGLTWADINRDQMDTLSEQLTNSCFEVNGKSTFKEEFVTAGGVDLKEVDFKTFQSKIHDGLYFAGEVLDIDAVTGGFNFQNAWTGGYIVAKAIAATKKTGVW